MEWFQHILSSMDRRPKAKKRFNLLRKEASAHQAAHKGLSSLAPFILFAGLPLAGIWQIQSDLDSSLTPSRLSSRAEGISSHGSALPGPSGAMCIMREDGPKEPGRIDPGRMENEKDSMPLDSRRDFPLQSSGGGRNDVRTGLACLSAGSPGREPVHNRPKKARLPRSLQAKDQALFRKAQGYQKQKNFEMAVEMYRRVLQENPGHCDALFHLSAICMEQGSYAEAYPLLQDLVRRRPGDLQGLVNLAIAEIALGRSEEAIAHLDRALTFETPPRFSIYLNKGVALSRLQRLEEAMTCYRKAEDLEPRHGGLLFNMAVTSDKLGQYKEALRFYTRFLEAEQPPAPQERRDVEARIGVLLAYLVGGPRTSSAAGAHISTEQKR